MDLELFSSLFFYHSLLYMPKIDFYLFNVGSFYILIFSNYVMLTILRDNYNLKNFNIVFYYTLLTFIFVNIVFYRISEHGTDRSAQILLALIVIFFIQTIYFEKNKEKLLINLNLILILIFLASSMKSLYYLYLIIPPIIFFIKKFWLKF